MARSGPWTSIHAFLLVRRRLGGPDGYVYANEIKDSTALVVQKRVGWNSSVLVLTGTGANDSWNAVSGSFETP